MNERKVYKFKRPLSEILSVLVIPEIIIMLVTAVILLFKFRLNPIHLFKIIPLEFVVLVIFLSVILTWVYHTPSLVVEDGVLKINMGIRKRDLIPLDRIFKIDYDKSFYIYYMNDNGQKDGRYLSLRKSDYEKLHALLVNKG
ncbi:hypothetical protein DAY19_14320 [Halobacteriovorax vibrionivorans]|uniref:DUF304 domain-containing protein n=1 Tax=Halobacteriovorax vibrionivorans TaxID=2152716 RepID=A0ABY0IDZ0_9BACT|nr:MULTISPECIES: hypothetical protein [Halobacteriovorax]RZF21149.1 hypothetical protein DAY19_14320 [Halobacteriovorax vibrionivorans]TGD46254.1 hypothetical protein EP118_12695 [Halobacteriovorax sp. Y22]